MNNQEKNRNKELAGIISEVKQINVSEQVECEECEGRGEAMFSCCTGEVVDCDWGRCPTCLEALGEEECEGCDGKGYVNA